MAVSQMNRSDNENVSNIERKARKLWLSELHIPPLPAVLAVEFSAGL